MADKFEKPANVSWKDLTFSQKWENFWFYYKKHVIIGAIILIMLVWLIKDIVVQPSYDYDITFAARGYFSDETQAAVHDAFVSVGEDLDGNGEVTVNISFILLPTLEGQYTEYEAEQAGQVKLMGAVTAEEALIYVLDDNMLQYMFADDMSFFEDLSVSYPDNELVAQYGYDIEKCSAFSGNAEISERTGDDQLYLLMKQYAPKNEKKAETKKELARKEKFEQQSKLVYKFIETYSQ